MNATFAQGIIEKKDADVKAKEKLTKEIHDAGIEVVKAKITLQSTKGQSYVALTYEEYGYIKDALAGYEKFKIVQCNEFNGFSHKLMW